MPTPLKYHYFSYQMSGQRPFQEDAVWIKPERGVFALADGFGGSAGEENKSVGARACESVSEFIENKMGDADATLPFEMRKYFTIGGNVIFNSLLYANEVLLKWNEGKNLNERGGASLCAGYIQKNRISLGNCGLCQGYLIRNGMKSELIQPRSYKRFLMSSPLKQSETDDFPLVSLGIFSDMQAEVSEYALEKEDVLIFMTDGWSGGGLTEVLADYQLNKFNYIELFDFFSKKLKELESQTKDNSTILLIKVA